MLLQPALEQLDRLSQWGTVPGLTQHPIDSTAATLVAAAWWRGNHLNYLDITGHTLRQSGSDHVPTAVDVSQARQLKGCWMSLSLNNKYLKARHKSQPRPCFAMLRESRGVVNNHRRGHVADVASTARYSVIRASRERCPLLDTTCAALVRT